MNKPATIKLVFERSSLGMPGVDKKMITGAKLYANESEILVADKKILVGRKYSLNVNGIPVDDVEVIDKTEFKPIDPFDKYTELRDKK